MSRRDKILVGVIRFCNQIMINEDGVIRFRIQIMIKNESVRQFQMMNELGREQVPFLFIIDFEMKNPIVIPVKDLPGFPVLFDVNGYRNFSHHSDIVKAVNMEKRPISYPQYKKSYDIVSKNLQYGNSFLANLTHKTEISINLDFPTLFFQSAAKYKLLYDNRFLVFSPETFITIKKGEIASFPMKGTIEKDFPNAEETILNDPKELAEHVTIVDLIRNDLSRVATGVKTKRFRFIDEIRTHQKNLLQVSSEITGRLDKNYTEKIGDILISLLPAGSVSGAPKTKTMDIIKQSEKGDRGFFTGIFGYFNGRDLDSGVMIRFMEKAEGSCFFRSGGGITVNSDPKLEYQEMIDKVYVPLA